MNTNSARRASHARNHLCRLSGRILTAATGVALACVLAGPVGVQAQGQGGMIENDTIKVFLDGNYRMLGEDFIRTEIDYVNWVRDQADADVHIIITSQSAGSGGQAYTVDFIGMGACEDRTDRLVHTSSQTDTRDEVRTGVVRVIQLGLGPYLLRTPAGRNLVLSMARSRGRGERPALPEIDPWNFWVFRTSLSGNIEGESSRKNRSVNGSFSARRITADWKTEFELNGDYRESEYELTDYTILNFRHTLRGEASVVKSLGEHFGAGLRFNASSQTSLNQHLNTRLAPTIEYSFYPYSDFTRRRLTLQYTVGATWVEYEELTLYDKMSEMLYNQSLRLTLSVTQPWGNAMGSIEGAHYFHDFDLYHVNANIWCDIRLFRGFSLTFNGRYGQVHDQLYLAAGGQSDEDILLRIRKLQTNFEYEFRVGFSYTFGSIFNAAVNPRLSGGGMERMFRR